jgi:P-type Cu+ transporter
MEKTMSVNGMSCNHCKMHVEKALLAVEGVQNAVVDLDKKNVKVVLSEQVSDEALAQAVTDAGYDVTSVQ